MCALYVPPVNFGMVEEDLYRCGQPNVLNFPFLEQLRLRTVVYLSRAPPAPDFTNFLEDQEIQLHHIGAAETVRSTWNSVSEDLVLATLQLVMDKKHSPMVVMCNLGRHRTGTVIGCLRKLQRWNLTSIFEEYRRYAGAKGRLMNEQFIELFDTDLVAIPEEQYCPDWVLSIRRPLP